jgi:hypothetical protein
MGGTGIEEEEEEEVLFYPGRSFFIYARCLLLSKNHLVYNASVGGLQHGARCCVVSH